MAVMSGYSNNDFLQQDPLFTLETVTNIKRLKTPRALLPPSRRLMETSLGEIQVCVDLYDHHIDISQPDSPDCFQLMLVLKGSVRLRLKEAVLSLGCGDVCLINTAQTIKTVVSADTQVATIRMPVKTLIEDAVHLGYHLLVSGLVFKPQVFKLAQLAALKHQILSLLDAGSDRTPDELKIQYRRFFSCLLLQRFDNNGNQFYKVTTCENPRIEKIRRWVIADPRKEYKPLDLAAYINVSERSLYHLFKKEYGLSPRVYICNIKLECIYRELMDLGNSKNITQIALEYGFNNLGRFSKVYRDYFGESPSETNRK